jgi:hypothetical protein
MDKAVVTSTFLKISSILLSKEMDITLSFNETADYIHKKAKSHCDIIALLFSPAIRYLLCVRPLLKKYSPPM